MSQIHKGAAAVKTTTFPNTARSVLDSAFNNTSLQSVILNEGLKELGECGEGIYCC